MHLSREDFDKIYEAFGPDTAFYECRCYEEEKEAALECETLNDYIELALTCESVWMDQCAGAKWDWNQEDVDEHHAFQKSYESRVRALKCEL